jgi:acyl carrier protein
MADLKAQLKQMLVEQLRLKMPPHEIADDLPLIGEGLGLDSIDVLQLSVAVEKMFGVEIRTEADARIAFANVTALAKFIEERKKP